MRKITALLLLFALSCSFYSCEKEDEWVDFTITFKALYDGQPLELGKNYAYGNRIVNFSKFSTYLSNIGLYDGNESQSISEIEYLNFTSADSATVKKSFRGPAKSFKGLQIGFGVAPNLNDKQPADFNATHPLKESEYWIGWKSYIFTKIEGNYDSDGDSNPETSLLYHCGSNEVYYTAQLLHDFTVEPNGNITVEFDVKKLFTFDGALLDLSVATNRATSHAATNIALGKKMIGNLDNAGTVK